MANEEIIDFPNDTGSVIDSTSSLPLQKDTADTRKRTVNDLLSSPDNTITYLNSDDSSPLALGILYTSEVSTKQILIKNVIISLKNPPLGDIVFVDARKETGYNTGIFNSIFSTLPHIDVGATDSDNLAPPVLSDVYWEKGRRMQFILITHDPSYIASGLKTTFVIDSIFGFPRDWFDPNYKRRKAFTVNVNEVPSVQNNFPATIKVTSTDLQGYTFSQFRFVDKNGVLDYYFSDYNSGSGFVNVHFKKSSIQDGDIVYMYYDNPTAIDISDSTKVYDDNYKAMYDMYNVGGIIRDNTSNVQHLIHNAYASNDLGPTGSSRIYDGLVTTFDILNPFTGFPTETVTIELTVKTSASSNGIFSYASTSSTEDILIAWQQLLDVYLGGVKYDSTVTINDGIFHHVVVCWEPSTGHVVIIVDGVVENDVLGHNIDAVMIDGGSLVLGQDQDSIGGGFSGSEAFTGEIDKVSISNIIRDIDWWKTIYNNERIGTTFWNEGVEEIIH